MYQMTCSPRANFGNACEFDGIDISYVVSVITEIKIPRGTVLIRSGILLLNQNSGNLGNLKNCEIITKLVERTDVSKIITGL